MTILYRVDNELLTIAEIAYQSLHEDTPLNVWLPVMYGEGEYCYYEDKWIAYNVLINLVTEKINALQTIKDELIKELE